MLKEIDGFPSLPDGCQSDWLKCALKAIDRVQEAIEWTGFFGSGNVESHFKSFQQMYVSEVP